MKEKITGNYKLKIIYACTIFLFVLVLMVYLLININHLLMIKVSTKTTGIYLEDTITYTTKTNNTYTVRNTMNIFEDNEEIVIYYKNSNEEIYITEKELISDLNPTLFILTGVLFGVFTYINVKIKKDKDYIIKNGQFIKCNIISIDNHIDKFWGPYTIITSKYEDLNNRKLIFKSDKLFNKKIRKISFKKGYAYVYYINKNPDFYINTEYEPDFYIMTEYEVD